MESSSKEKDLDLASRMQAHVVNRNGLSRDENGNVISPNGAWAMMLQAGETIVRLTNELERKDRCALDAIDILERIKRGQNSTQVLQLRDDAEAFLKIGMLDV